MTTRFTPTRARPIRLPWLAWFGLAVLVLGTSTTHGQNEASTASREGMLELADITLAYEIAGPDTGEAVLLIAGTSMQLIDWPQELVDALVDEGFRVLRFDHRDSGLSTHYTEAGLPDDTAIGAALAVGEPAPIPYGFDDMVADALALLDAHDIERAHVVGFSMGGAVAQLMAIDTPERVASLTLIGADSGNPELPMIANAEAFSDVPSLPESDDTDAVLAYRIALARALGGSAYVTDEATLRDQETRGMARSYDPTAMVRQQTVSFVGHVETAPRRFERLASITAPTVVVHGGDDPLVPIASSEDIAARVPDAELRIIPGWGHDVPASVVRELVDAIIAAARRGEAPSD